MQHEEFHLLDDVVVTLENDGGLHTWFQKFGGDHIKKGYLTAVFSRMNMTYPVTRKLLHPDEQLYALKYLAHRWLDIGPRPTYPTCKLTPLVDDKPVIKHVGISSTITGLRANGVIIDDLCAQIDDNFIQTEQRLAAHLSQETTVSKLSFKQQFLLNGTDVSAMPASSVYAAIKAEEDRIADLEKLQNKPKRLVKEIEAAKAEIKALVDYLDSKSE